MVFSYTNDGKNNEMDSIAVLIKNLFPLQRIVTTMLKSVIKVSSRIPTIPRLSLPIALATVATLRMLVVSLRNKLSIEVLR
jgi:short-subunit dehydrogenase involved in D-alanine esterification of teichoic acids